MKKLINILLKKTFVLLPVVVSCLCFFSFKEKDYYQPTYSKGSTFDKNDLTIGVSTPSLYEPVDRMAYFVNSKSKSLKLRVAPGGDYKNHLKKLKKRESDLFLINGLEALEAQNNGYSIVAKLGNDETYHSVVFVNKSSDINEIEDLKGKRFILAARNSILGGKAPLLFLKNNGVDIEKDIVLSETQTFESAILNVYLDKADAGAAWATMWDLYIKSHPYIDEKLEVKWRTPHLPNLAIVAKKEMDPQVLNELLSIMLNLDKTKEGKVALKGLNVTRIEKADSISYAPLRDLQQKIPN